MDALVLGASGLCRAHPVGRLRKGSATFELHLDTGGVERYATALWRFQTRVRGQ